MNSDVPPESFPTSAFEDFLAGKPAAAPLQGEASIIVPPAPEDRATLERIVANIHAELTHQLRSEATTVLPAGMIVRAQGNVGEFSYQPDVIVDADLPPPGAQAARNPLVIFEVAAVGSERAGFIESWQIHRALPTLGVHVLVDAAQMAVTLQRRVGSGWITETFEDPGDQLFLPTIHCLLSLEAIYAEGGSDDGDDQTLSSEPKITLS